MSSSKYFLSMDPDIVDWCNKDRISKFKKDLQSSARTLRWSQQIKPIIIAWIRLELVSNLIHDDSIWPEEDKKNYLSKDHAKSAKSNNKPSKFECDLRDQDALLLADELLARWSRQQWEHRLETLYLAQKQELDQVTCSILRVKDQYLAFELYQRLQCKEASFDQLSWNYGQGSERQQGGRFIRQRLSAMPNGLKDVIRKSQPGRILKPRKMGEWFMILSFEEFFPALFDQQTQDYLLRLELVKWLNAVTTYLVDHLE